MTPEQHAEFNAWREGIDSFVDDTRMRGRATAIQIDALRTSLETNTKMTQAMHDGLGDAIPVLMDLRGTARILKRVGGVMTSRPMLVFAGLGIAIWTYMKTGEWKWNPL